MSLACSTELLGHYIAFLSPVSNFNPSLIFAAMWSPNHAYMFKTSVAVTESYKYNSFHYCSIAYMSLFCSTELLGHYMAFLLQVNTPTLA